MPEVPFDAHQAYLEFYRPAVHVMRTLKLEGKLDKNQLLFFETSKPKEELYHLKNDPFELVNLANNPKYASKLKELRKVTVRFDKKMKPVSAIFEPVEVNGQAVIDWLKKDKPAVYQQMQDGIEVGYKKWTQEYKKQNK